VSSALVAAGARLMAIAQGLARRYRPARGVGATQPCRINPM